MAKPKHDLHLALEPEYYRAIESEAIRLGLQKSEIIKRALAEYFAVRLGKEESNG